MMRASFGFLRVFPHRSCKPTTQAWESFRPTTNVDLPLPPNKAPAHELVFQRKCPPSAFEQSEPPPYVSKGCAEHSWLPRAGVSHLSPHDAATVECEPAAVAAEERTPVTQATTSSRRAKQEHRPVFVPCLRSGGAADLTPSAPATTAPATAAAAIDTKPDLPDRRAGTTIDDRQECQSPAPRKDEDNEAGSNCVVETGGVPGACASKRDGRTNGTVAASVRAGDWVLPTRGWGGFPGSGTNVRSGGGSASLRRGTQESRWLRVEAVSIG